MRTLDESSLTPIERTVLDKLVARLDQELGATLRGVWLFGSRARGEPVREESDVDVIVVADRAGLDDAKRINLLVGEVARAEGATSAVFALHLYDPAEVAQRRSVRSFFFQEVDRDKIVLAGEE